MDRTNMVLILLGIAAALGMAIAFTLGFEMFLLFALTLPVCITLLWWSRDVATFSDRADSELHALAMAKGGGS
jgi:hypothetical protein